MSTAFYPTNMRQQPAGGYNSNSTIQNIPYIPWKGTGLFRNPVGVTATHIRPLTNNDPGNVFPTGFGLPRPIKHYRKGTVIPINFNVLTLNSNEDTKAQYAEQSLIEYNVNRAVKSSMGSSLGGGNGGTGLISQLVEMPGSYIVKDNGVIPGGINANGQALDTSVVTDDSGNAIDSECQNCNGVGIVSSWYPINNLTEKPEPNVTNPLLCCNQQRKAYDRVLPTNTNISKKYYQTTYMYLYHRCQTFKQRQFNFLRGPVDKKLLDLFLTYPFVTAKILQYTQPGDPLSIVNYYVAQCNPNFIVESAVEIGFMNSLSQTLLQANYISKTDYDLLIGNSPLSVQTFISSLQKILTNEQYQQVIDYMYQLASNPYIYSGSILNGPSNPKGCAQVIYKPNNPQFAKQGGVASSTRILKLNVDTISIAAARQNKLKRGNLNSVANTVYASNTNTPFIYKDKVPPCQAQTFIGNPFFFQGQHQNKLICRQKTNGQEYHTYNSINNGASGNYIGATQSGGAGYTNKDQIPNTTYFDNLYYTSLKNIDANISVISGP
jgi:hypothetical protein